MKSSRRMFEFGLWPLSECIAPHSGWFDLTDGWYTMVCGDADLMRYNQALIDATPEWDWRGPYPDYQVARLYWDLLDCLPLILEPVPTDLWNLVSTRESFKKFVKLWKAQDPEDDDGLQGEWAFQRHLDGGHLVAPWINFYNHDDQMTIHWDSTGAEESTGLPWLTVEDGEFTLPTHAFIEEVRHFDRRFIDSMQTRLESLQHHWPFPDVQPELDKYLQVHTESAGKLERALACQPATRWEDVRRAVGRMI